MNIDGAHDDPSASSSIMENAQMCWKCQALMNSQCPDGVTYKVRDERATGEGQTLSRTLETSEFLGKTAQEGCPLCQRFMHIMRPSMRDTLHHLKHNGLVYEHSIHLSDGKPGWLSMIVKSDNIAEELSGDEIKCFLELYPNSSKLISATRTTHSNYLVANCICNELELVDHLNHGVIEVCTDSESTWLLVSNWLARCTSSHQRCAAATMDPETLPSRVIDITPGRPLRLITATKSIRPTRYTTLSHCWGSHIPLRLLLSNIATLQKEIPFSQLTKSFQDAITISRRLGVHYIWIDSLCIIQDSAQDWHEQSATMARVYSNSYCNIAAAHAEDGTFGCFTNRNPAFVKPFRLDLKWGPNPGLHYVVHNMYWRESVLEAPLNMRAWVFQERTLAPRNLFFGATEVFFECREGAASEQFPARLPPQVRVVGSVGIQPHIDGSRIRKSLGLEADQSLDAFSVWGRLVERYSLGRLTYATDKLIALSALASEMQEHIQSKYLAGMWHQHLAYQLLWEVRGVQWLVRRRRVNEYIAPSWSWASVVGNVEIACEVRFADNREIIIEVLDAQVELVSAANPFGQVKSGFLRVRGSLARVSVFVHRSISSSDYFRLPGSNRAFNNVIWDDGEEEIVDQEFYILPIRYLPRYEEMVRNGVSMGIPQVSGIILRQVCPSKGQYVRVGKFEDFGNPSEFQFACRQLAAQVGDGKQEIEGWGLRHVLTIL